mmetsp:Transcript_75104/g.132753  ORF Transcript_75104/g.132753 Transcript_75104/m.132753 type:complete len:200 (-) Transcript_75104:100-699(-)
MPTVSQSFAALIAVSTISIVSRVSPFWESATVDEVDEVDECQGSLWESSFEDPALHGLKVIVEAMKVQVADASHGPVVQAMLSKLMPIAQAIGGMGSLEVWAAWQLEMRCAGLTAEFLVIVALLLVPIVVIELTIFALLCSKCLKSRSKAVLETPKEADVKLGEKVGELGEDDEQKASDGVDEKKTSDEEGASGAQGGA